MKRKLNYLIDEQFAGLSIYDYLFSILKMSKPLISHLKKYPDGILLNGKKANTIAFLNKNDKLEINIYEKEVKIIPESTKEIEVIYEDEDLLIVNKPSGLPVSLSLAHQDDSLASRIAYHYHNDFVFRCLTRLDKDTSGLVLLAKNEYAANLLSQDTIQGKIKKQYYAIAQGHTDNEFEVNLPIIKVEGTIKREINKNGQKALTKFKTIQQTSHYSLLIAEPITGRTHQIRIHLAALDHSIVNDIIYNQSSTNNNLALACFHLAFKHPLTKKEMVFTIPLDYRLKQILEED